MPNPGSGSFGRYPSPPSARRCLLRRRAANPAARKTKGEKMNIIRRSGACSSPWSRRKRGRSAQ